VLNDISRTVTPCLVHVLLKAADCNRATEGCRTPAMAPRKRGGPSPTIPSRPACTYFGLLCRLRPCKLPVHNDQGTVFSHERGIRKPELCTPARLRMIELAARRGAELVGFAWRYFAHAYWAMTRRRSRLELASQPGPTLQGRFPWSTMARRFTPPPVLSHLLKSPCWGRGFPTVPAGSERVHLHARRAECGGARTAAAGRVIRVLNTNQHSFFDGWRKTRVEKLQAHRQTQSPIPNAYNRRENGFQMLPVFTALALRPVPVSIGM